MWPGAIFARLFVPEQPDLFGHRHRAAPPDRLPAADAAVSNGLFIGGPPAGLERLIGLIQPGNRNIVPRMELAVLVGWFPLVILTAMQNILLGDGSFFFSFLSDYGIQARSLVAAPLLIAAEAICLPRLSAIAQHFANSELLAPEDAPAFAYAVLSTARLRDAARFEIALLAIAATLIVTLAFSLPLRIFPHWQRMGLHGGFSLAAMWHDFVSVPILVILLLGWVWRLILWTRFLALVSCLKLRLLAAHPDKGGGIKFVGNSLEAFAVPAFALGVIVAGSVANRVTQDGASLLSFRYAVLAFVAVVAVLFVAPLFVFTRALIETWRQGVFTYGALARSLGQQMERRWLGHAATPEALDANDFSATTDLYSIVANVYAMTPVPIALRNLAVLVAATLLPFLPVALMFTSPEALLQKLTGISF